MESPLHADRITNMPTAPITPLRVVIAGGGVGALEVAHGPSRPRRAAVRADAGRPDDDFVLRPMSVAVPFSAGHVTRVPLVDVCSHFGAARVRAAIWRVDPDAHTVTCDNGQVLHYDRLILATGAGTRPAYVSATDVRRRRPRRPQRAAARHRAGLLRVDRPRRAARRLVAAAGLRAGADDRALRALGRVRRHADPPGHAGGRAAGDLRAAGQRGRRPICSSSRASRPRRLLRVDRARRPVAADPR